MGDANVKPLAQSKIKLPLLDSKTASTELQFCQFQCSPGYVDADAVFRRRLSESLGKSKNVQNIHNEPQQSMSLLRPCCEISGDFLHGVW